MLLALNTGESLLIAVSVMLVFAISYALYTRRGSGVSAHRVGSDRAPAGSEGPAEESAVDEGEGSPTEDQPGMK